MEQIVLRHVSSVYSGTHGCCCGCKGKHTYASQHREWASKNRGYEVTDEDVGDRSVKLIVNRMNKMLDNGAKLEFPDNIAEFASVTTPKRVYIAYFTTTDK